MSTWAVVVAAGSGERLAQAVPKAFAPLGGRPLLAESVERLDALRVDRCARRRRAGGLGGARDPARRGARRWQGRAGGPRRSDARRVGAAGRGRGARRGGRASSIHDAARPLALRAGARARAGGARRRLGRRRARDSSRRHDQARRRRRRRRDAPARRSRRRADAAGVRRDARSALRSPATLPARPTAPRSSSGGEGA